MHHLLIYVLFFSSSLMAHAQTAQRDCAKKFKAIGTVVSQTCHKQSFNPTSAIKECSSNILFKKEEALCLEKDLTLEINHYKGGYPEGMAGGFRVDLSEGEVWEIHLCKFKEKLQRCLFGPPGSFEFGKKL